VQIWGWLAPTAIDSSRKNVSTHSIQQLVRLCGSNPAEVEPMQNALANLMPLFVDQNGCHCLSAALASLAAKDSQFIFDCACENALQISQGVPAGPAEFYALDLLSNFRFGALFFF